MENTSLWSKWTQRFSNLNTREKQLVTAMALGALLFLFVGFGSAIASSSNKVRKRISSKIAQLTEMQGLAGSYRATQLQSEAFERQLARSNVQLGSYLEERGKKAGVEIPSITNKPEVPLEGDRILEKSVEITLTDVPINRLIDFLNDVESGPGIVKVKQVRIEPKEGTSTVTAWTTIATYRLKESP